MLGLNDQIQSVGLSDLMSHSIEGDQETVLALIQAGTSVNEVDKLGRTALHYAALFDRVEVATILILQGKADFTLQDEDGMAPMMLSARLGHLRMLRLLLRAHAHCLSIKARERSALKIVATNGFPEVLSCGLLPESARSTKKGLNALHFAVRFGHVAAARALLAVIPADSTMQNNNRAPRAAVPAGKRGKLR